MTRWMPGLFLLLLGTDEAIKQYVEDNMDQKEERAIPGGKLLLRKVYNPGFALGTLQRYPEVVRDVSAVAGISVFAHWIYMMWRRGHWIEKTGSTLAAAGATGNLLGPAVEGEGSGLYRLSHEVPVFFKSRLRIWPTCIWQPDLFMLAVRKIL